jgi:hypothetical protein
MKEMRVGTAAAYEEPRCAVSSRLLQWCLVYPLAIELLFLVLAISVNINWVLGAAFLLVPALAALGFAYRNWPTGISIDDTGITIGDIRSSRALSRRPTVYHQSWGVYTCPWQWINQARVVTNRKELRHLMHGYHTLNNQWGGTLATSHCDIGVMPAPFTRAALVIDLWPGKVTGTSVRPSRAFTNFKDGHLSRTIPPQMSDLWVIPTQHPEELEEALRRFT